MNWTNGWLAPFVIKGVVVCVFCLLGLATAVAAPAEGPVVDEVIGSGGISWVPKVNYGQLEVRVARPDGTFFQKTFPSGSTPYLDLGSIAANGAGDGSYTYELRVIPTVAKTICSREHVPGGENSVTPREVLTQSGSFRVRDGAIIVPPR